MPGIERLHRAYRDAGLRVVAISVDQAASDAEIAAFALSLDLTFEILRDSAQKISGTYRLAGYPETFVIDREGVIRKRWIGPDEWDSQGNRALVAQLLGVPAAGVVGAGGGDSAHVPPR
jgi:peroxiredoxin